MCNFLCVFVSAFCVDAHSSDALTLALFCLRYSLENAILEMQIHLDTVPLGGRRVRLAQGREFLLFSVAASL